MAHSDPVNHQFEQALAALDLDSATRAEKIDMLMEIAMGMQQKPKHPQQLLDAVALYERALELCEPSEALLIARLKARKATALHAIPSEDTQYLLEARQCLSEAITTLQNHEADAETAEAQMNYGLVLQALAGFNQAKLTDAIAAYQLALRTFTSEDYPVEFAILHNNLATAFLSIPATDERSKMREALAVQSFEAALQVVTLTDQPSEYAMLQNNLGNALQYASSSHVVENNLRALQAYDESLRVRSKKDMPLEYANTISNKANCLLNLPDDPDAPERGNAQRMSQALVLLRDAYGVFSKHGDNGKAQMIEELITELESHDSEGGQAVGVTAH